MKHRIVVHGSRPWLRILLTVTGVLVGLVAGWGIYQAIRFLPAGAAPGGEYEPLQRKSQELSVELRAARAEIESLKQQAAYLARGQQIDRQACDDVRASLSRLEKETGQLREQLSFYRGIVSPQTARAGLRVHEFKVAPGSTAGVLRYDLVLIQSMRHDRRVTGRAEVRLLGHQESQSRSYKLAELAAGDVPPLVFSFRYFQEFSGEFRLPQGFAPQRVSVSVIPDGDLPRVEDELDWSRVMEKRG